MKAVLTWWMSLASESSRCTVLSGLLRPPGRKGTRGTFEHGLQQGREPPGQQQGGAARLALVDRGLSNNAGAPTHEAQMPMAS